MVVEILFSELAYYYGDYGNVAYLSRCLDKAEFIYTSNRDVPAFVDKKVDMVYLGSLSENKQLIAIDRLKKYKDILKQRISEDVIFLFTGNSMEILGEFIETQDGNKIECLGLYDFFTKRDLNRRNNYLFLGEYDGLIIVGNKSQYSLCYGEFSKPFIRVNKGVGNNPEDSFEGIHDHNLYATYLLGPFLVLNPLFTERLIRKIDPEASLAYRDEIIQAYNRRVEEMNNPKLLYTLHEH
ncbi:MAG: hypothetical protein J6S38_04165 [Erysipelotrichaceae bacterium]|nr:hypothetical protein [Erysipelotrichaceae bacterium]